MDRSKAKSIGETEDPDLTDEKSRVIWEELGRISGELGEIVERLNNLEQLANQIGGIVNRNVEKANRRHKELESSVEARFGTILSELNEIKHGIAKKSTEDEKLLKIR